jgi:hypothetical protein
MALCSLLNLESCEPVCMSQIIKKLFTNLPNLIAILLCHYYLAVICEVIILDKKSFVFIDKLLAC